MALATYTTDAQAAARIARYAGLVAPATTGGPPTVMDDYIQEASNRIEEFLGYGWATATGLTETIAVNRDGQGKLTATNALYFPLTSITAVAVPANAQYYGATIDLGVSEWQADGTFVLAYPVVYAPHRWYNPVLQGRSATYNSALKLYPDEVILTYNAGRADAPPGAFADVCCDLIVTQLMREQDPDGLMAMRQKNRDLELDTVYRGDPFQDVLLRLARWRRD